MSIMIRVPGEDTCPYHGPQCECEKYSDLGMVALDYCLVHELESLWESGVKTVCSCCGHGSDVPCIVVKRDYCQKMKELGYQELYPEEERGAIIMRVRSCGACGVVFRAKTRMPYEKIDKEGDTDV